MRRAGLCLLAMLASSAAAAEPFSLKCFHRDSDVNYFVTFEPEAGKVVYQGILNGGRYPGRVRAETHERVDFDVRFGTERVSFVWQPVQERLTVIGVPGNDSRPTMTERCVRTALSPDHLLFKTEWDWE